MRGAEFRRRRGDEYLTKQPFDLPAEHRIPLRLQWSVLRRGPGGATVAVEHLAPLEAA